MTLGALKKKKGGAAGATGAGVTAAATTTKKPGKDEDTIVLNEELRALEAHVLRVTRAGKWLLNASGSFICENHKDIMTLTAK
jgi:hypothetical protein